MRRFSALLLLPLFALPAFFFQQETPLIAPANLEITGINAATAPEITITVNVTDVVGQTVGGLTTESLQLGGPLAATAEIVRVERVTEDNLPFAVVLVIDTSGSMSGMPLQRTQAAAKAFVNALAPDDPVALVTFADDPFVLREFTTDRADLLAAIDSLNAGGQTALYDGAVTAIELAADAPYTRRAVVLLSDGAEYGGASRASRADAAELSPIRGVPVYSVGLGFGNDRTFLQQLSDVSSARFYESPTPEELAGIYNELATLFRTQYVVTLDFRGDLDGRIYPFTLRAVTEAGQSDIDAATLRAPIPVPIVDVSPLPTAPLASSVTFTADVRADQDLTQVEFTLGDTTATDDDAPYTFDFDPFAAAPGDYTLTVRATDADGDVGQVEVPLTVAAIASRVSLDTELSAIELIAEPVQVVVTAASQTPPQLVEFRIDGATVDEAAELPATFTLDPFTLSPGAHTVEFVVSDQAGTQAAITQTANIAALPPRLTIDRESLPLEIVEDVALTVEAAGQTPIDSFAFTLNGAAETVTGQPSATYTIRPGELAPGAQSLLVIVTDEAGTPAAAQVEFSVGLLPPVMTVEGVADDVVLDSVREITVTVGGQTPDATVTLLVDLQEALSTTTTDGTATLTVNPADLFTSPGAYMLSVGVVNAFGAADQRDFRVMVPEVIFPTPTSTATPTPDATGTASAEALRVQLTGEAQATADAGATAQAQATSDAAATSESIATAEAEATGFAVSTQAAQATADAQAALATQERESALAQATADSAATAEAAQTATSRANASAERLLTAEARATLQTQGTVDAQLTQIAQATADAQATIDAQATFDATEALATAQAATEAAVAAAVRNAEQTAEARETAQVELTADAESRATSQAEMTQAAQGTADAAEREAALSIATADAATVVAQTSATEAAQATQTAEVQPSVTPTDEPTETPEPSPTEAPTEEPTQDPTEAPTDEPTAAATELQATPTVFDPTSTPGSLTDVVAPGADTPNSQVALLAVGAGVLLLLLILGLIAMARRRR